MIHSYQKEKTLKFWPIFYTQEEKSESKTELYSTAVEQNLFPSKSNHLSSISFSEAFCSSIIVLVFRGTRVYVSFSLFSKIISSFSCKNALLCFKKETKCKDKESTTTKVKTFLHPLCVFFLVKGSFEQNHACCLNYSFFHLLNRFFSLSLQPLS